jgi:hypothetical protein
MEIICRECEGNAFRILPEERGTVAAECVVCGALTVIEVPKPARLSSGSRDHRRHLVNGHRCGGLASDVVAAANRR